MQDLNVSESLPQLDIRYILHVLWTGKWVILACMLVALALAAVNNNFQKVSYRAQAQIQIDAPPFLPSPGADFNAQSSYYLKNDRKQGEAVNQSSNLLKRQLYEIKSMLASQQTQMNQYA